MIADIDEVKGTLEAFKQGELTLEMTMEIIMEWINGGVVEKESSFSD